MKQLEIPYGLYALSDELKERLTNILVELKKRYDKEARMCQPPQYRDPFLEVDDHDECKRQRHRDLASAHSHAYFLIVKTFKLTEREAWSLIEPHIPKGEYPYGPPYAV